MTMLLDKIIRVFSSKKSRIVKFIKKIYSMEVAIDKNTYFIKFSQTVTKQEIIELLNELWDCEFEMSFHDSIYPTISDPGAYFSYSTIKTNGKGFFSMTYGNHGWSDGIFHIRIETISQQIYNLICKGELNKIQITEVVFFSHYEIKTKKESETKDEEVYQMHDSHNNYK